MKDVFIYKKKISKLRKYNLKRKLLFRRKLKFLWKKKIIKEFFVKNKRNLNVLNIFNTFKFLLFFNIYMKKDNLNIFFIKYNTAKILWILSSILYNSLIINEEIKEKIKLLFKGFSLSNLIRFLFLKIKKNKIRKKKYFFKNIFLKKIFFLKNDLKKKKSNYSILKSLKKKKRKFLKANLFIYKKFKNKKRNKIKIKMPFFFFNKYKKNVLVILLNYINKSLKLKIKKKSAFLCYWIRFYRYLKKYFFSNIEYNLNRNINALYKHFKHFYSLINLKKIKKKNKGSFFFNFFINKCKYKFLKKCRVPLYWNKIFDLFNYSFYKKNNFNIIYFFYKKNKNIFLKFKTYIYKLNNFVKIKFLIFFKNFIFIFILQYINFWFNYYLLINKFKFNNYNYTKIKYLNKNSVFIKKNKKINNFLFIKYIYFFFDNIIK